MKKILLSMLAIMALVAACVPSVNPFYTDKDVITDPRLAGAWQEDTDKDDPAGWKFEATTNNAYVVTLKEDKDKTGSFEGHLFKLGQGTFLDLTPTECNYATNQASMVSMAMIPGHLLLRVQFTDKKMNLAFCNPDWVKNFFEQNPSAIAHRVVDGSIILTADTGTLQKFLLKHLGKDELFSDGADYRRPPDTSGAK
ncbi:MAG TPA: hypothetical protein VK815_13970 [Candidatus Acidoferrales bacterium]|nr:hypothetical protein [Candidatus Acidoferrales bacterium]